MLDLALLPTAEETRTDIVGGCTRGLGGNGKSSLHRNAAGHSADNRRVRAGLHLTFTTTGQKARAGQGQKGRGQKVEKGLDCRTVFTLKTMLG
jgi:hypothetical protein